MEGENVEDVPVVLRADKQQGSLEIRGHFLGRDSAENCR